MHVAVARSYSGLQCAIKSRFHSETVGFLAWARGLLVAMPTANANARILSENPAQSSAAQSLHLPKVLSETAPILKLVPRPLTDAELVARALREGAPGRAAEEELYRRYRTAVQRIVATFSELDGDEVDDVVQESSVRAFRALKALKDPRRSSAWLFTIARNRARSYLTSRATHVRAVEEAMR